MSTQLRSRAADEADLAALVALDASGFEVDRWDETAWRGELTGPGRRVVVVESAADGEQSALDAALVTMTLGDVCDLVRIVVAPSARRRGVARHLLEEACVAAREAGADRMLLEVSSANRGAIAFYVEAGFTQIDERPRYYRDGTDALILRRALGPSCNWSA